MKWWMLYFKEIYLILVLVLCVAELSASDRQRIYSSEQQSHGSRRACPRLPSTISGRLPACPAVHVERWRSSTIRLPALHRNYGLSIFCNAASCDTFVLNDWMNINKLFKKNYIYSYFSVYWLFPYCIFLWKKIDFFKSKILTRCLNW